jgi:hypothetical protein
MNQLIQIQTVILLQQFQWMQPFYNMISYASSIDTNQHELKIKYIRWN